jgi:hypothetical protein
MYKKSIYSNKINMHLTLLALCINNKNKQFLTDDNKWSESFFKDLLNKVYKYDLVNLNTEEANYAGIDLGDKDKKICIQVTACNTSEKIQSSIEISERHKRYEIYDRLIILVVGYKKKYTKKFESNHFNFNKDTDVWDIRTVLEKISSLEINQMKEIVEFLDSELESVLNINPIDLLEEDIVTIINLLFYYLYPEEDNDLSEDVQGFKLVTRGEDFILQKNLLNKVGDSLFNNEIRPSLQYDKSIESFLGNPINIEYQKKYFAVTAGFQKIYSEYSDKFNDIGSLFGYIFDNVINYGNRTEIDDHKLLIVLHNMYFNCDLGNNPT